MVAFMNMWNNKTQNVYWMPVVIIISLWAVSALDFLLFHFVSEMYSIFIGFAMFMVVRATQRQRVNSMGVNIVLILSFGYCISAAMDLLHVITFRKDSIAAFGSINLTTQFWIIARAIEALTLVYLVAFGTSRLPVRVFFFSALAFTAICIGLIYHGVFPETFIDESGLTNFKVTSEYAIIGLLFFVLVIFRRMEKYLNQQQYSYIRLSIIITIASEFCFSIYEAADDQWVVAGHILKVLSFWFIYLSLVDNVLKGRQRELDDIFTAMDMPSLGLAMTGSDGRLEYVNTRLAELIKRPIADLVGNKPHKLLTTLQMPFEGGWQALLKKMDGNKAWNADCQFVDEFGKSKLYHLRVHQILRSYAPLPQYIIQLEDVSVQRRAVHFLLEGQDGLTKSLYGAIRAISNMLEARDPYTVGHSQNVASISKLLAEKMGLSPEDVQEIHIAGELHDIGKISVPTSILTKPSKLSPAEFELIKDHPRVSYQILQEIPFPWNVPKIVLAHHERWNGSGYPDGLVGYDIPMGARILAVADTIDSMAADRPYRKAPGLDAAFEVLQKESGVSYDPEVIAAALKIKDQLSY